MASGTNMSTVRSNRPAGFDRHPRLSFKPGPTVTNTPPHPIIGTRRTPEFDRPQPLRIANVAKNECSYAHVAYREKYLKLKKYDM